MQSPSLDILFVQLWNGAIFSSVISPFFDLSDNLSKLGQKITPAMDRGGLIHFSGLTLLLTHEPLLNSQTGQVVGRIVGATVLNDNLAVLDTIHDLTRSETVVLVSNGELISSTAPRNSEIVQKLAAGAQRKTHGKPYLEADFGSNLVAGFIPISFSGNPTSLVVATAVADDSYTFIRNSYRFHLFALPVFSIFVILFMIMLVHKSTSTPFKGFSHTQERPLRKRRRVHTSQAGSRSSTPWAGQWRSWLKTQYPDRRTGQDNQPAGIGNAWSAIRHLGLGY